MAYNELLQRGTADFPFELYHIDRMHPKYVMAHHWHTELEIVRVIEGKLNLRLNDREYTAKQGDVLFFNSEVIHSAVPDECEYECIVFDASIFAFNTEFKAFVSNLINHDSFITEYFPAEDDTFHSLANELFDTIREKGAGHTFSAIGLMFRLFGEIEKNNLYREKLYNERENAKSINKLKKVLEFIRNSYAKQITLKDMSKAAEVSPKYFCAFFKEMTSKTPIEYLNGYRIERASRKLLGTDASITDIAYDCGFNDLSYFIKVFKEQRGMTPQRFRNYKKEVV